jgi:endonuclease-8
MPEGDSVHRFASRLEVLVGDRIAAESPHPRAAATGVAAAIDGRVLEGVEAVGKHLLLRFDGGVTVRSHLRMSGRWRVERRGSPRSGRPWLVLRGRDWEAVQWNGPVLALGEGPVETLGPDLLAEEADLAALARRLRGAEASRPVGDALLDQHVVAGIGNMWMAEMLWQARLSPWLPVDAATDDELLVGLEWARRSMRAAVTGTRPLRNVYRRAGRPCRRCAAPIRSGGLGEANRTAYWCDRCQRAGSSVEP